MTSEWVAAIASVATFVVIAATAIAALVQLRHMRSSNQLAALSDLRGTLQYDDFWETTSFVIKELPIVLSDPSVQRKIADETAFDIPELARARKVANYFDTLGAFVKAGIINPGLVDDIWGDHVTRTFDALRPLIANVRVAYRSPAIWENFEYLTVLCEDFDKAHPGGNYPSGVRRAPMPELWPQVRSRHNDA